MQGRSQLPPPPLTHSPPPSALLLLQYRPGTCKWWPDKLDASLCTHAIYSFSSLTDHTIPNGPTVQLFDPWAFQNLQSNWTALRTRNPSIKLLLAIGGW